MNVDVPPTLFVLSLLALVALQLAWSRPTPPEDAPERDAAARALAVAAGLQAIHFAEEAAAGLPDRLGALFGQPAVPRSIFVAINVAWLGVWVASVPGLRAAKVAAFFAAWFLALAGMFNGIVHPLFAIAEGTYFPGLVSSPLTAVASVRLWLRLREATAARNPP